MSKLELVKIMYGCNNGQIPERIEQLFSKTSKVHQYNTRQLMMFSSYQELNCNQAKTHCNAEAVNCGTVFYQK